ncbi:dodecin family protein [Methanothrix sp.]|uniref:dodecin family protein n=1 Tax=Methanothrix sp. TaxID=90426 RepID=UPI003C75919B
MKALIGKSVYNFIELVGTSNESWEDAVQSVVRTANRKLTNMRIAEVTRMDSRLAEGGMMEYRARVTLSFKHEVEPETL